MHYLDRESLNALGRDIELIVCDLDGTLLNSGKQISRANLASIEKARGAGVFATICTGRVHTMLRLYSKTLDIQGPLIAANGAVIFDTKSGKTLYQKTIDTEAALALLSFCGQKEIDCSVLCAEACFFMGNNAQMMGFAQYNDLAAANGLPPVRLSSLSGNFGLAHAGDIFKILIYEPVEERQKAAVEFIEKTSGLEWTSSSKGLLDVSAIGVSKGDGVRRLAEILGVDCRRVCVFGDYYNDISMMKQAGLSIAMGNAPDDVKRAASAVTADNDEDGVALGIEEYVLQAKRMAIRDENP